MTPKEEKTVKSFRVLGESMKLLGLTGKETVENLLKLVKEIEEERLEAKKKDLIKKYRKSQKHDRQQL